MNTLSRIFPWLIVAAGGLFLAANMFPPREPAAQYQVASFGKLPLLDGGRVKPLDTVARTTMMMISNRQTFTGRDDKSGQPAVRWLLDLMTPEDLKSVGKDVLLKVTFRIDDDELLETLKLKPRPNQRYTLTEVAPHLAEIVQLGKQVDQMIRAAQRSGREPNLPPTQRAIHRLYEQWEVVQELLSNRARDLKVFRIENDQVLDLLGLEMRTGSYRYSALEIAPHLPLIAFEAARADGVPDARRDVFDVKVIELMNKVRAATKLGRWQESMLLIPTGIETHPWAPPDVIEMMTQDGRKAPPALGWYKTMLSAWAAGDKPEQFNRAVEDYAASLGQSQPKEVEASSFETFFNHFAPFYHCAWMYVGVSILACLAWVGWTRPFNRAAFWLMVLTLVVHTWALLARMYLMDRPLVFVTNLYSSAIFIGWGCVVLGVVLETFYRNGLGNLIGSVAGSLTLVVAHNLSMEGDTLQMMQAVLDTNFWLATHVTTVTLGYTATFVAGGLGFFYILRGLLTVSPPEAMRQRSEMIYGVVCFATLLSFVGTVLGGIWADQSWGRFWGWDPKENGALLIVIWNAMILHARWGGMVKGRGVAVLAVLGNIVTAWSWFGTNMLGVGLHSYGFMAGAFFWLMFFAISQLIIAGIGLIPLRYWRSYGSTARTIPPPESAKETKRVPAASPR